MKWSELKDGTVVCKTMTTETAHRLIDYSGKCASIHGHSYKWEVTAALETRDTLPNGISIDFGHLKKAMRACIYDVYDHALVLADIDPLLENEDLLRFAADGTEQKIVRFAGNPTAENFARHTAVVLREYYEQRPRAWRHIDIIRVRVWETANSYGQYQEAGPSNF